MRPESPPRRVQSRRRGSDVILSSSIRGVASAGVGARAEGTFTIAKSSAAGCARAAARAAARGAATNR